jgi:CRISPR-associated protein Cmr2
VSEVGNLLVFSVGPVQSFIASARKIEDLWSGSYILSHLAEQAMSVILEQAEAKQVKAEMIYPPMKSSTGPQHQQAGNRVAHIEVASQPNRFICWLEADSQTVSVIARQAEKKVRDSLVDLGEYALRRVFPKDANRDYMLDLHRQQVDNLLEVYWATEPFALTDDYNQARNQVEKRLAAVKNARPYHPYRQQGLVCTLCGEQQALISRCLPDQEWITYALMKETLAGTWNKRHDQFKAPLELDADDQKVGRIKDNEGLCGICLSKRLARDYFKDKYQAPNAFAAFPSTQDITGGSKYYAILMMDGDDMGKWVSGQKKNPPVKVDMQYQQDLSKKLEEFALTSVPKLVNEFEGKLIYAGGDDVLAFVPVRHALNLARSLRLAFSDPQKGLDPEATASIGVVVVHAKAPLAMALEYARQMESKAKAYRHANGRAKDALGLAVITHSGEIREAILPWAMDGQRYTGEKAQCSIGYLLALFQLVETDLSVSFIEHFAQAFLPLLGADLKGQRKFKVLDEPELNQKLLCSEMHRVLERSKKEDSRRQDLAKQAQIMIQLHELMPSGLQFIHLLEMARFFKRTGGDKS